jgi:hypothetical protein
VLELLLLLRGKVEAVVAEVPLQVHHPSFLSQPKLKGIDFNSQ